MHRPSENANSDALRIFDPEELQWTGPRRAYVQQFFRQLGYDARELPEEHLRKVFLLLSRAEEYATTARHNGQNWEMTFAPLARREQSFLPLIETRIASWVHGGLLPPRGDGTPPWPGGKRFALCLSHDIDVLHENHWRECWRRLPYLRQAPDRIRAAVLVKLAQGILRSAVGAGEAPTPPLDLWLEVEDRFSFKSTCHFMADPMPRPCWKDAFYRYGDSIDFEGRRRTIGEVIREIAARGWDVGLHGSCRSHASASLLREEKLAVERASEQPVVSTRQHYLTCDVRVTPRVQAEAGLEIDSTFGSNMHPQFRCGTGLPFYMYDLVRDQPLPIVQIPLIVQEAPLARNAARDEDLMVRTCLELMDRVASVGGAMTLLWHNHFRADSVEFRCYQRVLAAAAERDAWGCSMSQLNTWFRRKDREALRREHRRAPTPLTIPDADSMAGHTIQTVRRVRS